MPDDADPQPDTSGLSKAVLALAGDAALRPVLIVVVLITGTVVAGGVLLALRAANIFAMAAVAGMALMTFAALDGEIRTARRVTPGVWAIASIWLAAALVGSALVAIGAF